MGRIGKIYRIESELQTQQLEPQEFVWKRKDQVLPILNDIKKWLKNNAVQVPPSTLLGKAVSYALGEWEKLVRYVDLPQLTPDTKDWMYSS